MRSLGTALVMMFVGAARAWGQPAPPAPDPSEGPLRNWSLSASVFAYFLPDERNYAQPSMTADHGALHLEGRYNYEGHDTGSAWVGYNFDNGGTLSWTLTPMLGGVFGHANGVAPGYRGTLAWWKVEFYSEGEYVFDLGDSSNSFLFNWSELSLAPADWIRAGLVTQRTRVYQTDRDIQRGVLVGLSYKRLDVVWYVLNPDESKPTVVLAVVLGS